MPKYGRAAHAVTITHTGPGDTKVILDGTDIATSLTGLSLTMGPGQVPTVTLDLRIFGVTEIQDIEARILVPDATRDTLIALGWTPPADPSAEPTGDLDVTPFLVVHRYPDRVGSRSYSWSWHCWGDGTCAGWTALDFTNRDHAERSARGHLATEHPAEQTATED